MSGKRNQGSMIIELTILMPVFLLCVVLYLSAFLYYVKTVKQTAQAADVLYSKSVRTEAEMCDSSLRIHRQGSTDIATSISQQKYTNIKVEMKKDAGNPISNLRRWKNIADAVGKRGDS